MAEVQVPVAESDTPPAAAGGATEHATYVEPDLDPRDYHMPPGSYTPFAKGIAAAFAARGDDARKPVAMRVGEGRLTFQAPARAVPRNQRFEAAAPPPRRQAAKPRAERVVLDGFLLLDACHVDDPDDAVQAVLEGCGISGCVPDDLAFFTRLTHLDVGDNALQLERLSVLPNLLELHMDCNGVGSIDLPAGGFPRLEVLNLSYNGLTAEAVGNLAKLACLRELDLTGNRLARLPPDWTEFLELRKLTLDRNSLCSDDALIALGTTPYLKELSLELNQIKRLPAAAVENGGFGEVEVLNLAQNQIGHEDALVPVLQMARLRTLSVWGNPFIRRTVPQAFEEVLTDRAVALTVDKPVEGGARAPLYDSAAVLGLDLVVNSHRPAELAMRGHARHAPPPQPKRRENPHVTQARAQLAADSALESELGTEGGGFFVTQVGAVGGEARARGAPPTGGGASALDLKELQDALLLSDESESLIDGSIDVRTAINALKYALEHPLVEFDIDRPTHHLRTTAAHVAGRRDKFVRAADPLDLALEARAARAAHNVAHGRQSSAQAHARQAALERGIDSVPEKLEALKRNLKVAEVRAHGKTPMLPAQSMQSMLSAINPRPS